MAKTEKGEKNADGKLSGHILCTGTTSHGKGVHGFVQVADSMTVDELHAKFQAEFPQHGKVEREGFTVKEIED